MTAKDEEILGVWSELFVGHALSVRAVEEQMVGKSPLSVDEYDVMLCISRSPEQRIRFSALAEITIYTRSGISRILKRLEKDGFVRREGCPEDKRGSFASLTPRGRDALREAWSYYGAAILRIFGPIFSQSEAHDLRKLLGRLVDRLSKAELVQIRGRVEMRKVKSRE